MLIRLLALFITVPIVELALLLWLGDVTDRWWIPLALVIVTGVAGAILVRRQGLRTWQRIRMQLQRGEFPGDALLDGVMILIAGVLLITPGMLTDSVGLLLLVPAVRAIVKRRVSRRFASDLRIYSFGSADTGRTEILDVQVVQRHESSEDDGD